MVNNDSFPKFMIGGVQKCGTTSLHYFINQHKDIFMPVGKQQETHFFDTEENYQRGLSWYKECFKERSNEKIIGQTSPLYLFIESVPERIYSVLPETKFIFIVRNQDKGRSQKRPL